MLGLGPDPELAPYFYALALILTAIAAFTDWRTGEIPNWITLPPIFAGPLVHGLTNGADGLAGSLLAIAFCGLVPFVMWKLEGMEAGDLKMFVGIAALVGPDVGLEAEFLAFVVAGIYALGRLAWEGKLLRTVGNSFYVGLNPLLPQRMRRPVARELLQRLRLGGAIFAGTLIAVYGRLSAFLLFGT